MYISLNIDIITIPWRATATWSLTPNMPTRKIRTSSKRNVSSVNKSNEVGLNLYETTKLTYASETPLTGGKYLHSKAFYGSIGADVQEMFSVNEMEKDKTSFFASTTPYQPQNVSTTPKKYSPYDPEKLTKGGMLKNADRNTTLVEELMTSKEGY
jgi:hypothetical protein